MRFCCLLLACCIAMSAMGQDSTENILLTVPQDLKSGEKQPVHIFNAQRVVNANTVEMVRKGILEFKISHNFDDLAGKFGGLKNFFGLDNAIDIRIGFQYGISDRFNVVFARFKGDGRVQRMYELGLKWLPVQQMENDPSHPLSVALYSNAVVATMKAGINPELENFVHGFSERLSFMSQLMIARKFGKSLSLQLNPTIVHRNNAIRKFGNGTKDQQTIFAMGGAARIHLGGRYSLLLDYFHAFRNKSGIDSFKVRNIKLYDAIGVGFEVTTWGHIFQINFTNATDMLENKFIPYTIDTWELGQFRWGFSISRNFDLLYKKKKRTEK